ncbi:glycerate kinase family protein [Gordonia iterans]
MTDGERDAVVTGPGRRCRVLVMPDSFGGTLDAVEAAAAIGAGWHAGRPQDSVLLAPQSDGGPGFVDVLATAFGGEVRTQSVAGPLAGPVRASWLLHDGTAYVEAAQACGLHLLPEPPNPRSAWSAGTAGVGDLISAALLAGCRRIVVGLGGSATTDGGRGAADRLGGLAAARRLLRDVELVAATDVDNPLLGPAGAAAVFSPQKGADPETVALLEERLTQWAAELAAVCGRDVGDEPGAGAAGGLGALLLACGGRRESGARVVADETHRRAEIARADLVITGEGRIDAQTRHGKLVAVVADEAAEEGVPVLVLAGQSSLSADEEAEFGVVHSLVRHAGSLSAAMTEAGPHLTELAAQLAARWRGPGDVALGE